MLLYPSLSTITVLPKEGLVVGDNDKASMEIKADEMRDALSVGMTDFLGLTPLTEQQREAFGLRDDQ